MKTPLFFLTILLSAISIVTTAGTENLRAEETHTVDLSKGALLLSFDDFFITQWMAAAELFNEFDAHATFFVMQPDRLSKQQIADLTRLHEAGHSIGCHSMRHLMAVDFMKKHGIEKYMEAEITPAMQALNAAGLSPTAFSYPNSQRNAETDEALRKVFRHLRTSIGIEITKEKRLKDVNAIFIPADQVAQTGCLRGINIDYTGTEKRPDDYFEQICEAMQRAKSQGEVVVLYGHNISDNGPGHYLRPEVLRKILAHAKKIGLPVIGYDELP